jgi:hypothetical protein
VGEVAGTVLGRAGGAVAEGSFADCRQRQDVPAEGRQLEREPTRVGGNGPAELQDVSRGAGDVYRSLADGGG